MGPVPPIEGLLDTHALLWTLEDDARLANWLRAALNRDASRFGVSDVSVWEVAIKRAIGKLKGFDDLPETLDRFGFIRVPIASAHVWAVGELPSHHGDPFDRLLVAQARALRVPLVSADPAFAPYDVPVTW